MYNTKAYRHRVSSLKTAVTLYAYGRLGLTESRLESYLCATTITTVKRLESYLCSRRLIISYRKRFDPAELLTSLNAESCARPIS